MYKTKDDVEQVIALRKPDNVIDHFVESYLQGVEYEAWTETKKAEHSSLFPLTIDGEAVLDADGTTVLYYEQIPNPDYIEFDTWMKETEQVQVGTKDVLGEDGITVIGTEPIYEDRLIREYVKVPVDVNAWKIENRLEKRLGLDYNGYLIPFMNEDAVAMLQVKAAFEMGVLATNIEFSNGTVFPISAQEFATFAPWFVAQRNSYFI